ncbi:MAG: hypothetical protein VX651_00205 [Candidatus Neomarinimicrobiota bacterium]|nr:hypothetical protein [Candidatus Neomarinimicrobiota bacterium]
MKKVEVYFLINLGAILSLFAIEGELAEYKHRQDDILKNVAQDKLQTLVEISNVESNYENPDHYRLFFNVEGQYEQGSIEFNPSFTTSIVEVDGDEIKVDETYDWELDSVTVEPYTDDGSENRYVAKVKLKSVEENYLNQPFDVDLGVKFIPDIDSVTYNQWSEAFGNYKVTNKLLKIINKEVSREGSFTINREFDTPITLIYMDGQQSEFFVLFDKEKYTVLRGLNWEIPFSVGGVNTDADFSIELAGGKDLVKELVPGLPRAYIKGKGTGGGTVEVVGLRKRDKKSSITSARIVVVDPQYSSPSEEKEIYIGEQYVFDSRVKDVDRDEISVKISGSAVNTKTFNSFEAKLTPKSKGQVKFETFVDGNAVKGLTHEVKVRKIPPPKLEFKRIGKGSNNLLLTVTTFGNKNGKKAVVPLSGIYGKLEEEQPEKRIGNRRVVKYSFELDEPQFGETTEIKIKVIDKYKAESVSDNEFEYYD